MEETHLLNQKFRLKIQNYVKWKHFYNISELKFKPLHDLIYRICLCQIYLIIYVVKLITHSEIVNEKWVQHLKNNPWLLILIKK